MLRFLSRKNRNHQPINNSDIKSQRIPSNKNLVQCRVILLDNSDISIELSVSPFPNWIKGIQFKCARTVVDTQKNMKTFFPKNMKEQKEARAAAAEICKNTPVRSEEERNGKETVQNGLDKNKS